MHNLQDLIEALEQDRSLDEPDRLRQRIEALDRLDALGIPGRGPDGDARSAPGSLHERARVMCARLEAVNSELFQAIRGELRRGAGALLSRVPASGPARRPGDRVDGEGYDYLDALVSGVLPFEEPRAEVAELAADMVFYQPTPARHIFDLIRRTGLGEGDVLIDLGSGLGHVPLLTTLCTGARSIGIEREAAYVDCARRCARSLNLSRATFIQQDARAADLSGGTVFYLYTPFSGAILREVLDQLRREAAGREIRICTLGPCTPIIAAERWLGTVDPPEPGRIAIFHSLGS